MMVRTWMTNHSIYWWAIHVHYWDSGYSTDELADPHKPQLPPTAVLHQLLPVFKWGRPGSMSVYIIGSKVLKHIFFIASTLQVARMARRDAHGSPFMKCLNTFCQISFGSNNVVPVLHICGLLYVHITCYVWENYVKNDTKTLHMDCQIMRI